MMWCMLHYLHPWAERADHESLAQYANKTVKQASGKLQLHQGVLTPVGTTRAEGHQNCCLSSCICHAQFLGAAAG